MSYSADLASREESFQWVKGDCNFLNEWKSHECASELEQQKPILLNQHHPWTLLDSRCEMDVTNNNKQYGLN